MFLKSLVSRTLSVGYPDLDLFKLRFMGIHKEKYALA